MNQEERRVAHERLRGVIAEHYGLEIKEGDAIVLTLRAFSEIERDAAWGAEHGWNWSYWPDGTKTIDFPAGRIRLPMGAA